ncbi:prolyl oligopeptidase family serine peptidase [Novosphingobium sp. 1949]|uniref:Prolyl oligopeptidase family serine peptidase n=2 Tax=Novosphingobium organovorum TaxID=2930092 RepID=A0ABT0BIN0_9SPHN|nr:prolyl oligopeptidase family serine peptidase [Novosphingobium organovorum]
MLSLLQNSKRPGFTSDRLLLVGISQGTMMALHVGLRRKETVVGIVGVSGTLVAPDLLEADIRGRPPVLLVHGTQDEVVPFRSMGLADAAFTAAGVPVEMHVSPGLGHSVGQDGLEAAAAFARTVIG